MTWRTGGFLFTLALIGCGGGRFDFLETCGDGTVCADGECRSPACVPNCGDRVCGDDGCGAACGACQGAEVCDASGRCVAPPADCGDRACDATEDCATCPADCGQC